MSEDDGEPSDEREDEGSGPCAFEGGPPFSSVASVGIVVCVGRLVIMRLASMANRRGQRADQSCEKQIERVSRLASRLSSVGPTKSSLRYRVRARLVDPADWRFQQS